MSAKKPREVKLRNLEESVVEKEINKALARAEGGKVKMCILTLPEEMIPEHLEIMDKDKGLGTVIEAWATGEVEGGYVTGLMRHKDDAARLSVVDIPLAGLQGIILRYQETPKAIHRHRLMKMTYTVEEIAAATGMSVAEVEKRAKDEGWAYLAG